MASKKEPPFFNDNNVGPCHCKLTFHETMELFIETLTGTYFELRVSPFETVISVKIKIQRLEGIPVSQQHLIWNNMELEDDYCLIDYGISEGCTLKLILAMRGGPINTKKVSMEDPVRDITEYMDPIRDEVWEKVPSSKQVTFLVYREGEQLNFFRIVDRGDGTLTPLTESLSGGSIYNLHAAPDDDSEASLSGQRIIENSITMNKMKLLKAKMENINLNKQPKKILRANPHPPTVPCPSGTSVVPAHHKLLRALPQIGQSSPGSGNVFWEYPEMSQKALSGLVTSERRAPSSTRDFMKECNKWERVCQPQSVGSPRLPPQLLGVEKEDTKLSENLDPPAAVALKHSGKNVETSAATDRVLYGSITNVNQSPAEEKVLPSTDTLALLTKANFVEPRRELCGTELQVSEGDEFSVTTEQPKESVTKLTASAATDTSIFSFHELSSRKTTHLSPLHCSTQTVYCSSLKPQTQSKCVEVGNLRSAAPSNIPQLSDVNNLVDSASPRTLRVHGISRDSPCKKTNILSKKEARGISEMGIKASKDPIVSANNLGLLSSLTRSTNRDGLQNSYGTSRFRTSGLALSTDLQYFPEESFGMVSPHNDIPGYVLSSGLGLNGNFVTTGKRIGNATHLPPVNGSLQSKKKTAKHCFFCGKKTGLATSYECRCGNNFCATHRYAETHTCTYDYKNAGRRYLQESNPVISAPKLPKI
nr:AN1-type zinc finger protein 4 isoform X2 [Pogona vitticeps]